MQVPHPHSQLVRNLFFVAGIIATLAYRVIVLIDDRATVQALWYIGTVGFIIYFAHRYQISTRRGRLIVENDLERKIAEVEGLGEQDKASMEYIFKTLRSSKEKWNSVVIFVSSIVALVLGAYLDFIAGK